MTVTAASTSMSVRSLVSHSPLSCALACRMPILPGCRSPQAESAGQGKNSVDAVRSTLNSGRRERSTVGEARTAGGTNTHWHIRLALQSLARRFLSCGSPAGPRARIRVARAADDRVERLLLFPPDARQLRAVARCD